MTLETPSIRAERVRERAGGEGRFVLLGVLGEGGMGRVLAYEDRALGRRVAVKIGISREHAAAIEHEARLTGALEHPNIIPVYDVGRDEEWGPFYVMRLVEQPSLEEALASIRAGEKRYSHGKLLRHFIQVCQALDYAHSRGIVHCDLKPDNVLLGDFGEVFIVDWGFALRLGEDPHVRGGTAGYMPPEQLSRVAADLDQRADVFALGAILYQLLTDERPFPPVTFEAWAAAKAEGRAGLVPPIPPSVRAPNRKVPPELEEICLRAIELDRDKRLASAREMATALDAFLDSARAKKRAARRAEELTQQAEELAERHREMLAARPARLAEIAALRASIEPWETGPRKLALLDAEDGAAAQDMLASRTFQLAVASFERALEEVAEHAPARRGLTRLYEEAMERAAARRDEAERVQYEALALAHDDGPLAHKLASGGAVLVETPGVDLEVVIEQLGQSAGRVVPVRERARGASPLGVTGLEAGAYLVRFLRPSKPEVKATIRIRAGRETRVVVDPRDMPDDAGEVLIPGGSARLGGHATNLWARESREIEVPAFVLARFPVTFRDYLEFAATLFDAKDADAKAFLPCADDGEPYFRWRGKSFAPGSILKWGVDPIVLRSLPVVGVDVNAARAYCAWRSARDGRRYRLPTEWEWEKAARGVDGRPHPWGDGFDPTFCKMRESRQGPPLPEPIGAFEVDASPYGVRDLAGGVADWVIPIDGPTVVPVAVSRGGAWCDWSFDCHAAARRTYSPGERSPRVGFRLARDATSRDR